MDNLDKINQIKNWLSSGSINIFGKPFSGKDSQGARLASILGGNLISSGDIFRNSVIPNNVKEDFLDKGKLMPSEMFVDMVLPYLKRDDFLDKPLILSSVGRWHGEEEGVIGALNSANHKLGAVFYLNITDEEANNRWSKIEVLNDRPKRNDDAEGILGNRIEEFNLKTLPVIEYYRQKNILYEIDGNLDYDTVTNAIIDKLYELATA